MQSIKINTYKDIEKLYKLELRDLQMSDWTIAGRIKFTARPSDIYRYMDFSTYQLEVGETPRDTLKEYYNSPECFNGDLYSFQKDILNKSAEYNNLLLNVDLGLGKTIMSLYHTLRNKADSILIVAPLNVLNQWERTLKEFFNLDSVVIRNQKNKYELFMNEAIVITNFEQIPTLLKKNEGELITFDTIIVDEVSKIKNWETNRSKALTQIISKNKIGLTGTPIENKIDDVYNIADYLKAGSLGGKKKFNERYKIMERNYWGGLELIGHQNLHELNSRLINEVMVKYTKEDLPEALPELNNIIRPVTLNNKEKNSYWEQMADLAEIGFGEVANCKVFSSNPAIKHTLELQSNKEKELEEIIFDEMPNKKIIVFTEYKKNIYRFKDIFSKYDRQQFFLSGDNSNAISTLIEKFIESDNGVLFMTDVGQYGTDGLQVADTLIHFDLPWNPARYKQRTGRIHRLGIDKTKTVITLIHETGYDEYLMNLLNDKDNLSKEAISGKMKSKLLDIEKQIPKKYLKKT